MNFLSLFPPDHRTLNPQHTLILAILYIHVHVCIHHFVNTTPAAYANAPVAYKITGLSK